MRTHFHSHTHTPFCFVLCHTCLPNILTIFLEIASFNLNFFLQHIEKAFDFISSNYQYDLGEERKPHLRTYGTNSMELIRCRGLLYFIHFRHQHITLKLPESLYAQNLTSVLLPICEINNASFPVL